jgi:dTDP-4-dehydrorhamnose 3,5-epimerase
LNLVDELLPGALLLQPERFVDQRGTFVKTYHKEVWARLGIDFDMREEYYSTSRAGVIRGMHFQTPPHAHDKVVFCLSGKVQDVLLDLRPGANFGRAVATELSAENRRVLFIPAGIAHGFQALEDDCLLVYKTSTVHSPESDRGIRWDSFGFDWGNDGPIVSIRDMQHPGIAQFNETLFGNQ